MASKILERIAAEPGIPRLFDALAEDLSPADLQSLLLEVYRARAAAVAEPALLARVERAGMLAHFRLFSLVSAGRDTGSEAFEIRHLGEHIHFYLRLFRSLNARGFRLAAGRTHRYGDGGSPSRLGRHLARRKYHGVASPPEPANSLISITLGPKIAPCGCCSTAPLRVATPLRSLRLRYSMMSVASMPPPCRTLPPGWRHSKLVRDN